MVGITALQQPILATSEKKKNPAQVNENTLSISCAMRTSVLYGPWSPVAASSLCDSDPSKDSFCQCQSFSSLFILLLW